VFESEWDLRCPFTFRELFEVDAGAMTGVVNVEEWMEGDGDEAYEEV
jgi:hypothetical protein